MPSSNDIDPENGISYDEQRLPDTGSDDGPEPSNASRSPMRMRSESPVPHNGGRPMPLWLHESSKSFHWRWVPLDLRKVAWRMAKWSKGPDPPQIQKITPFFPSIQEAPARLISKYFRHTIHKAALLLFFYFCWLLTFSLVLNHSATAGYIEGYGKPSPIWCGASYWYGDPSQA